MRLPAFVAALAAIGIMAVAPNPVVTRVTIAGDPAVSSAVLISHLAAKPGVRYSDAVREQDAKAARDFYEARHLELGSIVGGIDPASVDAKAGTAAVKYSVYAARVVGVDVDGTADVAQVTKLLHVRPGMLLNTELVRADEQRLRMTGRFTKVNVAIKPGPYPNKPQDITLAWVLRR